jgi:hypothetical protein
MTAIAGCILVSLTYFAALRVHNGSRAAAAAAAALTALCPNLLSQALVTSDLWSAVGFLAVAVSYDSLLLAVCGENLRSNHAKSRWSAAAERAAAAAAVLASLLASSASLALLCLSKMSCVLAAPIQLTILASHAAAAANQAANATAAAAANQTIATVADQPAADAAPAPPVPASGLAGARWRSAAGRAAARGLAATAAQCTIALLAIWCARASAAATTTALAAPFQRSPPHPRAPCHAALTRPLPSAGGGPMP